MPWPGAYTASDKLPVLERIQPYKTRFFVHIYSLENLEFIDTPVNVYIYVVTIHKYKSIMMVLIVSVRQITLIHVSLVENVAHMRFFSNRACEFLNQENFCYS